jgi:single-stranded-DNA-specific exonuclease
MEIKNLKEAAERILKAIESQERILLYGDADLDGVCSVIILKETIRNLGGEVKAVYFPDREVEGYGISEKGLNTLKKFSPALLISLDCGISNFKEIELAKKYGFFVIVIDHHKVLDELPKADIIVNPQQKSDKYPFKGLATVGITFKLSEKLLLDKMANSLRRNFLELVALATLADMMPQVKENKILTEEGLEFLKNSWRPAFQVFSKIFNLPKEILKVISILNVRDVENNLPASYRLLSESDFKKVECLIEKLIEKGKERRKKVEEILAEIERKITGEEEIIFEGSENWGLSLISIISSFLCQKYQKPVFIYKKFEKESQGTVRVPPGIDSVSIMKRCKELLISFGGHPSAAGFRIKNENLDKFKSCLIKNYNRIKEKQQKDYEKNNNLY